VIDLATRIRSLSLETFDLVVRFEETHEQAPAEQTARIRAELQALAVGIEDLPEHEREGVRISYSEAIVDLNWLESGGILATSVRLAARHAGLGLPNHEA
jgi:hypothetical protein